MNSYKKYFSKIQIFPERIIIEPTNKCNLNCVQCPRKYMKSKTGFMNFDKFKSLIDELKSLPATKICLFFRGEPFLHPKIMSMIKYIKNHTKHYLIIFTNGILLDKTKIDKLILFNLDFISFSLDSINESSYQNIRKNFYLNKIINNIEYFGAQKSINTTIQVSMVETYLNAKEKSDFIKFWQNKVDRIRIYKNHSENGKFGTLKKSFKNRKPCLKPLNEIAINYKGDVTLCCYDWERDKYFGNVFDTSFIDVWNSESYHKIRMDHYNNNGINDPICNKCGHWQMYYNKNKLVGELY